MSSNPVLLASPRLSKIKFYSGFDTDDGIVPLEIQVENSIRLGEIATNIFEKQNINNKNNTRRSTNLKTLFVTLTVFRSDLLVFPGPLSSDPPHA
jgi:hypothetical protein